MVIIITNESEQMLSIISPSKTMAKENALLTPMTNVYFEKDFRMLLKKLQKMPKNQLQQLMATSDKLTDETFTLYQNFPEKIDAETGRSAVLAYSGDVYQGLNAKDFTTEDIHFAQEHLRILSGLFGVLRPLDLIAPYRLEMATSLETGQNKNLYGFWSKKITDHLHETIQGHQYKILVNLASGEYFKVIDLKKFDFPIYHVEFKEVKNSKLTGNAFTNKKMRGVMANYIIKYKIDNPEDLMSFSEYGFLFSEAHSKNNHFVFLRPS
jgi:cytoplasmic iron level regulating protein YaaA (DUF328/UPF0246 family)